MTKIYKKRGRKRKRPSKYEFEMRYYQLDIPAEELAKYYGVEPNTIYNWAVQFRKEEQNA